MRRFLAWLAAPLAAQLAAAAAAAAPIAYKAPPETAVLAPGPNSEVAQAYCSACHSADYITTQPRKLAQPAAFWTGEVAKMKKAYGARLPEEESKKIIAYLAGTYAK